MQIFGYIVAGVALICSIEAIPQFGHAGFNARGPMMGPVRGGYGGRGFGGSSFGGMGSRRGPAVVSKTVLTKTIVHG